MLEDVLGIESKKSVGAAVWLMLLVVGLVMVLGVGLRRLIIIALCHGLSGRLRMFSFVKFLICMRSIFCVR
ncbi:hypothetical protein D3C72_1846190 [compost metagenome]